MTFHITCFKYVGSELNKERNLNILPKLSLYKMLQCLSVKENSYFDIYINVIKPYNLAKVLRDNGRSSI